MAETFTMNETPVNSEILNSDEQDSLAVAESLEGGEQPLLAGKFKDPQALEQAYVELQKKLGLPDSITPSYISTSSLEKLSPAQLSIDW